MMKRYRLCALGTFAIVLMPSALYIPFFGNALVFDDHNIFTNLNVYDYAQTIFNFHSRTFPYFTLGITQVLIGSMEAQRAVSLALHIVCSLLLFALLAALLKQTIQKSETDSQSNQKSSSTQANSLAFVGSAWFAIHPVAVYGAGYLVQRTILFATIFSLLSLWFYQRAFAKNRSADIVTAALFYSLAVFSKEHAVMLPLAAVALTLLYGGEFRSKLKRAGLYLLLCIPAAITVTLVAKGVVATSYEPYVGEVTTQIHGIPLLEKSWGPWFVSVVIQAGAFFDYFYYWIIPDIRSISADMRIDFVQMWTGGWLFVKAGLFVVAPFAALYCLLRGRYSALFGFGLLFSWLLYAIELSTVRFQEPFVLYRSYLWAPGFIIMLLALLSQFRWQVTFTIWAITTPLLFILAQDRLQSFASERMIWNDAAAKLQSPDLPGADRIYYNRGGERFKQGQMDGAMEDLNRVVALNPRAFQGYLGRGLIYLKIKDYRRALDELDQSLHINPKFGFAHYPRGAALEALGRKDDALDAYAAGERTGDFRAKMRLQSLRNSVQ